MNQQELKNVLELHRKWFLGIKKGDIPQNNAVSKLTVEWTEEFMKNTGIIVPSYKLVSSLENPELFLKD